MTTSPTAARPGRAPRAAALSLLVAAAASLAVVIAPAPAHADTQTVTNATPIAVPPGGTGAPDHSPGSPYPSPIAISGLTGTTTKVTVRLNNFTHQLARDLDVILVGPGGQSAIVASDVGSNNPASNVTLTLDDAAADPLPNTTLTTGTFKPTDLSNGFNLDVWPAPAPAGPYGTSFAAFNGTNPNGTWNLYVVDDTSGDAGTIAGGWTLTIETGVASFPGQLQLSNVEYRGTEGGGVATVTVNRVNGDDGAVGVSFATGTGSATAGADYTPVTTTLAFADGQSSRTVDVPIAQDAVTEGIDELVPITLSSPTGGATLGSPTTGQIRIQDDDAQSNSFPIATPATGSVNNLGAAGPYPSNIVVSGAGGVVTDVDVNLFNVSHTHIRDLDIVLVAPNGASALLMVDVGPNTPVSNLNLKFSDEAVAGITQTGLTSGTYKPSRFDDELADALPAPAPAEPWGTTLAALDGTSPNGTWSLYVADDAGGDIGQIAQGWSIEPTVSQALSGGPYTTPEGSGVTLSGSTSPNVPGATYAWDVDGDGQYDDATGANPTVSAATLASIGLGDGPDSSSVRVRATAGLAVITSTATTLTITNVAPTATLSNTGPVPLGTTADVTFAGQTDPSSSDTAAGFRYSYDLDDDGDWEVGDGTYAGSSTSATATVPTSVLNAVGTFEVNGRVLDKDGGQTTYTTTITVEVPPNAAPAADAGPGQLVNAGDTVTLDGTDSTDPEDDALSYSWVQTAGPAVTLAGATTAQPTFTAPEGPATLTFELTVDDGELTDTDTVTVTVNGPSTADAGPDQEVNLGDTVTLDGTGSSDPDGDELGFSWVQSAGPAVTLTGATTAQPTFTAPEGPATLTFELTVDDDNGRTDTDTVTITVNGPPVADAGADQDANQGDTVTLDGTGSTDPADDELTYSWVQTAGPAVTLVGATTAQPAFTAPAGPGTLTFELTVDDGNGRTDTDEVSVTLNSPPVADAGADQVVTPAEAVTLDGTDSTDPDDDELSYSWVQTAGPAVTLTGATTAQPTFTAPAGAGTLTFELTVDDGRDATDTDTLDVTVDAVAPSVVLSAPAGPFNAPYEATATFSEPVTGVSLGDFGVTNGAAADLAGSGDTYTVTVTPAADGDVAVTLPTGAAADVAGNPSTVSNTLIRTYDATSPTVDLTAPAGPVNGPFTVTVEFSEPVTGLTAADVGLTNATGSDFAGSGDTYTLLVTPTAEGEVTVSLPEDVATDAADNGNTAATPLTRDVDLTRPSVELDAAAGPVNGPFPVTITFSEPVTGLTTGDLTVTNGSASALTGSDAAYTVTITPAADGPVTVTVADEAADDAAGNTSTASEPLTRTADASAPTVVLSAPPGPHNAPYTVTATFSEPVTGVALSDLVVTNGTASDLAGSGTTYTVLVTPAADGDVTVALPGGSAVDAGSNGNVAATPLARVYDATDPTLTLTRAPGQADPVRVGEVVFVAQADEPVTDLAAADVTVLGATGADTVAVTRIDADSFEVVATGMTSAGTVQVRAADGAVADPAGNAADETTSATVRWAATRAPLLTPLFDQTCLANGGVVGLRLAPDDGSVVSVSSSNSALLPASRIGLARSGDRLRLTVRPLAAASGVARVTITATNVTGTHRIVVRVAVGTSGRDRIVNGPLTDILLGRGGDDVLKGNLGNDLVCGGAGDDRLRGGQGRDSMYGQAGDDVMVGVRGRDKLVGGPGRDRILPQPGKR